LTDILTGTDRILNTPLPLAYTITITQISWAYILLLPMQLVHKYEWGTPLVCVLAAYIILGFAAVGTEIENPFGLEVNDLPLEAFCDQIDRDIDIIMSNKPMKPVDFMKSTDNMPLYPLFLSNYAEWSSRSEEEVREGLKLKVTSVEAHPNEEKELKKRGRKHDKQETNV
jgi:putative membrane protein